MRAVSESHAQSKQKESFISNLVSCAIKSSLSYVTTLGMEENLFFSLIVMNNNMKLLKSFGQTVLTLSNVFLLPPQLYYLVLIVYTDHKMGNASRHWECIRYCLDGLQRG